MNWEIITERDISWIELETLQHSLVQKVVADPSTAYLLVSEPHPTFTYGRNSTSQDLLWDSQKLTEKNITVAPVTRGGKWTYHGPGQIVCYPIAHLATLGFSSKGSRPFVETLRQGLFNLFSSWGVPIFCGDEPFGIFAQGKKLAAFGLSFERGISSHGVAVYLSNQEPYFSGIHPCGMSDPSVAYLHQFLPELKWDDAACAIVNSIKKGFKIS